MGNPRKNIETMIKINMTDYNRKISKCYILEEDLPIESSPIRICNTKKLAEHYKRILTPKYLKAFGIGLRIVEYNYYEEK